MIRAYGYTTQSAWEYSGKAALLLGYAHDSAASFLDAFDTIRASKRTRGATTDEEQDLLRGMLVFSASGLDGVLKQLIRDALPKLLQSQHPVIRKGLERFTARQLGKGIATPSEDGVKFLSRILTAENQQARVIEEYIYELTGSSLQSGQEIVNATSALGQNPAQLGVVADELQEIFKIRNKIIHELDINFDAPNRNRTSRSRDDMVTHSSTLLAVGERVLRAVDQELVK